MRFTAWVLAVILIIPFIIATDFTPSGNIDLKHRYNITNTTVIDGFRLNGNITNGTSIWADYFYQNGSLVLASSNGYLWSVTGSLYIFNSSGVLEVNTTKLNATIDARENNTDHDTLYTDANASWSVNHSSWDYAYSHVRAVSGNWNYSYDYILAQDDIWNYSYNYLLATSGNWNLSYNWTNGRQDEWELAYNWTSGRQDDWEYSLSHLLGTSGNWNASWDSVSDYSANWNYSYTHLLATSGNWNLSYNWTNNRQDEWEYAYSHLLATSGNWNLSYNWTSTRQDEWERAYANTSADIYVLNAGDTITGNLTVTATVNVTKSYRILLGSGCLYHNTTGIVIDPSGGTC